MHGGFRPLVNPGTPAHLVDIEGTKQERASINEAIRRHRQATADLADSWPTMPKPSPQAQ